MNFSSLAVSLETQQKLEKSAHLCPHAVKLNKRLRYFSIQTFEIPEFVLKNGFSFGSNVCCNFRKLPAWKYKIHGLACKQGDDTIERMRQNVFMGFFHFQLGWNNEWRLMRTKVSFHMKFHCTVNVKPSCLEKLDALEKVLRCKIFFVARKCLFMY